MSDKFHIKRSFVEFHAYIVLAFMLELSYCWILEVGMLRWSPVRPKAYFCNFHLLKAFPIIIKKITKGSLEFFPRISCTQTYSFLCKKELQCSLAVLETRHGLCFGKKGRVLAFFKTFYFCSGNRTSFTHISDSMEDVTSVWQTGLHFHMFLALWKR